MTDEPEVPTPGVSGDREERRLVAAVVRLVMRLPRVARWGLLAAALGAAGDATGLDDAVLRSIFSTDPPAVHRRAPDLDRERADAEALRAR